MEAKNGIGNYLGPYIKFKWVIWLRFGRAEVRV